jgi:hypothetical protein
VPVTIASERGLIEVMTMEFVEIAEDVSREDVLANRAGVEKLDEAIAFLKDTLADGDWHDSAGLVTLAGAQKISERTLRRAALEGLQVEHERRGFPSTTWWRSPVMPTLPPKIWHDWTPPHEQRDCGLFRPQSCQMFWGRHDRPSRSA